MAQQREQERGRGRGRGRNKDRQEERDDELVDSTRLEYVVHFRPWMKQLVLLLS